MDIAWWWSWLLAGVGLTGLWLAGSHKTIGWKIGVAVQILWVIYAVVTQQWGFIFSAIAYGFVNGRNVIKWNKSNNK